MNEEKHEDLLKLALENRDKHYRSLIRYICTNMPKYKRNAFTLATMLSEGSTYGHTLWVEFMPESLKEKYLHQR